jgi:hypothetical protein
LIGESAPSCDFGAKTTPRRVARLRRSCNNGKLPAKTRPELGG